MVSSTGTEVFSELHLVMFGTLGLVGRFRKIFRDHGDVDLQKLSISVGHVPIGRN